MKLVKFQTKAHETLWQDFLQTSDDATPYHTREWASVIRDSFGFSEQSLVCINESEVIGILPLWLVNKKKIVSSPWRDRGSLITKDECCATKIFNIIGKIKQDIIIKGWLGRYLYPDSEFTLVDYWITSELDLELGKEKIWKTVNKNAGRNIRKSQNMGVQIKKGNDINDMHTFYQLFRTTRKRLGVPIYPWLLFSNIWEHMIKNGLGTLYLSFVKERVVGGAIVLNFKTTSIYAYGASDVNYNLLRSNDLLFWKIIEDNIEMGLTKFDFGADSPQQTSLLRFKKKWGAVQIPLYSLIRVSARKSMQASDFSSEHYRLHRKILSAFPVSALEILGKYLSRRDG